MKTFIKYLQQIAYFLPGIIMVASCKSVDDKNDFFRLNPVLHQGYNYSLTRTSEKYNKPLENDSSGKYIFKTHIRDTIRLKFAMESIHVPDSLVTFKLTFNDFVLKRPVSRIVIIGASFPTDKPKNPFLMLDSVGHYLHGRSVEVTINNRGNVESVTGIDDLFKSIYKDNKTDIQNTISDYVSKNAIKDILNIIFSVVPNAKINEADKWVRNVTLITKAPVKYSNLYILEKHKEDTAYVSIQSIISAEQSEGFNVYMKGKQSGKAIVSYSTGMPYLYETESDKITTTDYYDVVDKEHFILVREPGAAY